MAISLTLNGAPLAGALPGTAAEGDHGGGHEPNPILPATEELLWGILAFAILLLGMWKFGFPAIKNGMDARADRIRDDLDAAEGARAEAEGVLEEYRRQLADARQESNRIIEEARQQAERVKADMISAANAEVTEVKTRATADIEAARSAALQQLQSSVGGIAIELAEKVVERNLDRETNQRLVESFIQQVGTR